MKASRSRWLELRRDLQAAQSGREVLDQKRELLLRHLAEARLHELEARALAGARLAEARQRMKEARISIGTAAVEAALLAQPEVATVERRRSSVMGIPVPRLEAKIPEFRRAYGPLETSRELDEAGAAWREALIALVRLADAELVSGALEDGLVRTARRLGALETVVLPGLRREIREIGSALDEEERDEALRRRRFMNARSQS